MIGSLLPECLDDYVTKDNPVQVIETIIDGLDLKKLGFAGMVPQVPGRPAYHPSMMLKLAESGSTRASRHRPPCGGCNAVSFAPSARGEGEKF